MPPGRGGKWHKEAASVPYWFGKINKRSSFYPSVSLHLPFSGSFEKMPTGCLGAWERHRLKSLKDNPGGEGEGPCCCWSWLGRSGKKKGKGLLKEKV